MNFSIASFLFLTGLFFGSFANVISLRLAEKKSGILFGRSQCPKCNHQLSWFENIPLFSWIFLLGRCRNCKQPISWQYPAAELFFAFLFGLVGIFTPAGEWYLLIWRLILIFALGIIALSDLRYMDIPDRVSLPTIRFLVLVSILVTFIKPVEPIPNLQFAFFGAAAVFGFFSLQVILPGLFLTLRDIKIKPLAMSISAVLTLAAWLFLSLFFLHTLFERLLTQGKGAEQDEEQGWIGGGDFRVAVIMGLTLGPLLGLLAVFIGYFAGALFVLPILASMPKSHERKIPLGPFLVIGTVIALLWGEIIIDNYLRFIGLR